MALRIGLLLISAICVSCGVAGPPLPPLKSEPRPDHVTSVPAPEPSPEVPPTGKAPKKYR